MTRSDTRSTVAVCALLSIVLAAALAGPAVAASSADLGSASTDGGAPGTVCVIISTDPPNVGVYERCSGSGTVFLDDQPVI